jgi:hypothetical protein
MEDYTFTNLTAVEIGFEPDILFNYDDVVASYPIEVTNGTISIGNMNMDSSNSAIPGFLTGRRPRTGQVFPRGVYNK